MYELTPARYLGTLCKHSHDHGGGSYRRNTDGKCVECCARQDAIRSASPHRKAAHLLAGNAWRRANPEKTAAIRKRGASTQIEWVKNNPVKRAAIQRKYLAANLDKHAANQGSRRAKKRRAQPAWADTAAIAKIYVEAKRLSRDTGVPHEVDHIVPLISSLVSGLHVPANLQILPREANRAKGNKFEVLA